MNAEEFRALVEQLGELSEVQRAALVAALSGKGSAFAAGWVAANDNNQCTLLMAA